MSGQTHRPPAASTQSLNHNHKQLDTSAGSRLESFRLWTGDCRLPRPWPRPPRLIYDCCPLTNSVSNSPLPLMRPSTSHLLCDRVSVGPVGPWTRWTRWTRWTSWTWTRWTGWTGPGGPVGPILYNRVLGFLSLSPALFIHYAPAVSLPSSPLPTSLLGPG